MTLPSVRDPRSLLLGLAGRGPSRRLLLGASLLLAIPTVAKAQAPMESSMPMQGPMPMPMQGPIPMQGPNGEPVALVTFAPAHGEMTYFLRITSNNGAVAECYTPCTLALPAGPALISVLAPRAFQREIVLSGRTALIKVSHRSNWRYGVGALVLGLGMAEFIAGAVYFPWGGGGSTTAASSAAAAWAFGAIELTSAITLLALGGKDSVQLIDDPSKLKAAAPSRRRLQFAGAGPSLLPIGSTLNASFRF